MNYEQIKAHLEKKYANGTQRATCLVSVLMKRHLIKAETESEIVRILNEPICTGVIFGQLAENYHEYMG